MATLLASAKSCVTKRTCFHITNGLNLRGSAASLSKTHGYFDAGARCVQPNPVCVVARASETTCVIGMEVKDI